MSGRLAANIQPPTTSPANNSRGITFFILLSHFLRNDALSSMLGPNFKGIECRLVERGPLAEQPLGPFVQAGSCPAGHLKNRRSGVKGSHRLVKSVALEVDQVDKVELVEHDNVARRENLRILYRLVVSLGCAQQADL